MPRVVVRSDGAGKGVLRVLSLSALALPVIGAFALPAGLAQYEALLWLSALVPALVLGRERGWEGVGVALGVTVAVAGGTYIAAAAAGQAVPELLWAVGVALAALCVGVGWLAEGVSRLGRGGAPEEELVDVLTGLPTRAQAELFLEKEFAAARLGRPLVVVLFDLDQFREFNLRHGSAAGNGVLKAFATLLRQNTRRMNLSARWGPEEFLAILCGSSQEGALIFADRVQELLRAASGTTALPTVSAGVAFFRPNMSDTAELLAAAQEALLRAKQDGRDRVRIYGTSIQPEADSRGLESAPPVAAAAQRPAEAGREERCGIGRSAFVFTADGAVRGPIVRLLADRGFRVTEGIWPADGVLPLKEEYDLVLADVGGSGPGWADLVSEIRERAPATRIVGIPRREGETIPAAVLAVRVDGYCMMSRERPVFHPDLPELLSERDRLLDGVLRERQLSGEVRAKEREGRLALAESEARYRSVVQRVKEVIFEGDREGCFTFLNGAWSAITGHGTEDSLGRELFGFLHQEDEADARREYDELLSGARPYMRRELRVATASGQLRWVEMRAQAARNAAAEIMGVSGLLTDVHERKEAAEALRRSEEYFRALIENSADLMAVVDRQGNLRYSSPALERVLGFRVEERIGHSAFELIHADDADAARACFARVLATPAGSDSLEVRVLHRDGSWRWLEVSARNLLHVPSVHGLVINGRDVTDRKEAERALRDNEELLYRAQKMDAIGRLAGGVAHDFNNLLTAVQGSADRLLDSLPPESTLRAEVIAIRDASGRANSLTRQLLAFSRKQILQPRLLDISDIVQPMEKMLERLMGSDIRLRVDLKPNLPRTLLDPQQIEQVLLNLAVNARDAMPQGGTLSVRATEARLKVTIAGHGEEIPPGDYVLLSVADTGAGIPGDQLAMVFDPFFATKTGTAAPGLGLSTVYGIVKQSGGYIRVESVTADAAVTTTTGSTYTVYLPVHSEPARLDRAREQDTRPHDGRETIALVEDEKAVRELAQRILRNKGYNVITAENGRHAVDVIGRFPDRIDLLVTDVVMPEMNGRDLADRVTVMRPGVKVLFMSGYTEDAIVHHGVLADGTAFLQKPFSPDGLVSAVREVLDGKLPVRKPVRSQRPPGPLPLPRTAP